MSMIALDQNKNIVLVSECNHPQLWQTFWNQVGKKPLSHIALECQKPQDHNNISRIVELIQQGFRYIIANRFIFLGILYWDTEVFDDQILEEWGLFQSRKAKRFQNLLAKYHENDYFPEISDNQSLECKILGIGEKFFDFKYANFKRIAKMTQHFRGNLFGIFGIPASTNVLEMVILSQNITKKEKVKSPIMDRRGRQTLNNWIKMGQFIPTGGFKIAYGINGLENLSIWPSIVLLPKIQKIFSMYQQYLSDLISDTALNYPQKTLPQPFQELNRVVLDSLFEENSSGKANIVEPPVQSEQKPSLPPQILDQTPVSEDNPPTTSLKSVQLPKIALPKPQIKKIPSVTSNAPEKSNSDNSKALDSVSLKLSKPDLGKVGNLSVSQGGTSQKTVKDYEDIFNVQKKPKTIIQDGKTVLNPEDIEDVLLDGTSMLEGDLSQSVDPRFMDENTIFQDLESSLKALSKLDELAEKDAAQMRLYYPPPTLVSYANEKGMEIGGSTCVLSIGVGRNIWAIPELRRMQMWGEFWRQEDVEGNPQIKDFIDLNNGKDINSPAELEDILQKAFIRIRRNSQLFLGVAEFEGNGFESRVFPECDLSQEILDRLADIHSQQRSKTKFPEISQDSWIELKYFGKPEIIKFLANPNAQGALEIANDINTNPIYASGIITGIVCLEEEAANYFILTDNFNEMDNEEPSFHVDQATLDKMFETIDKLNLTPVSWCKMTFGFRGFEDLSLWEDIKEGVIMQIIQSSYKKYSEKLMNIKESEDLVRIKLESDFKAITDKIIQCPHCGTENSSRASNCMACGKSLK